MCAADRVEVVSRERRLRWKTTVSYACSEVPRSRGRKVEVGGRGLGGKFAWRWRDDTGIEERRIYRQDVKRWSRQGVGRVSRYFVADGWG